MNEAELGTLEAQSIMVFHKLFTAIYDTEEAIGIYRRFCEVEWDLIIAAKFPMREDLTKEKYIDMQIKIMRDHHNSCPGHSNQSRELPMPENFPRGLPIL